MQSLFIPQKQYRIIQFVIFSLFIAVWFLANDGLAFWDDFTYLNFAQEANNETFKITDNHFTSRVGMIYPVAFLIELFGINAYTVTLFPMFCTLALLGLTFWIGNRFGHWVGIIVSFFILVDYHTLTFSTHLFPEMPMVLCVFGALLCYDVVNRREGDYRLLALFMSLLLLAAFLIKTSIFICIPLFLYLLINDWRRAQHKPFWVISIFLLTFFFLLHGFWYQETFGDFWYRFNNISNNHEATDKTFFDKTDVDIIKRLTYLPFIGFTKGGFFIPLLFGLPALLKIRKADWSLRDPSKLWAVAAVFILGSWWFISTNWKYYSPMPTDTRHITFVIPVLLMAGAQWWLKKDIFQKLLQSQLKWAVALGLLAIPFYKITKANDRGFKELEETVETYFVNNAEAQKIITDGLLSYGYPYFYDFLDVEDEFEWWVEMDFESIGVGDYLLVNSGVLNTRYEEPGYLQLLQRSLDVKGLKLEEIDLNGTVSLYRIIQ